MPSQNNHDKVRKAYENLDFLHSPDARTIRMLCEYLEPARRFRREKIRDTVVFFGSARTQPAQEAEARLDRLRQEGERGQSGPEWEARLARAERAVAMSRYYEEARELASRITSWSRSLHQEGRFVICSGGGPGIMQAANRGAIDAGGKSMGLTISIPDEGGNEYISDNLEIEFHYFFMRKYWFMYLAKAMVIFPGGFGTLDELMEILTLRETHKITKPLPIVLYGSEYWNEVLDFEAMIRWGTISRSDVAMLKACDTTDDAFDYLTKQLTKHYLK